MPEDLHLYDGIVTTRAIRRYRPDDIPEGHLNKMLFAATRGPSGHKHPAVPIPGVAPDAGGGCGP